MVLGCVDTELVYGARLFRCRELSIVYRDIGVI